MTPAHYKDAMEERSIAKLCGYPVCSNKLGNVRLFRLEHICPDQEHIMFMSCNVFMSFFLEVPSQKYKISTKTNKVYDLTERKVNNTHLCLDHRTFEKCNCFCCVI